MIFSSCLKDEDEFLIADASVLINLIASGEAAPILRALPMKVAASEAAVREINSGAANGRPESKILNDLISEDLVEVMAMKPAALDIFSDLVSGSLAQSLGDGEAATVAMASLSGGVAVIDEKKATKVCRERFSHLKIATSVDILSFGTVQSSLGKMALEKCVARSLKLAKMQVWDHQLSWIIDVIGEEQAKTFGSLNRLMRARRGR